MKHFRVFAAMLAAMLMATAVACAQEAAAHAAPIKLSFAKGFQPADGLYELKGDTLTKVEATAAPKETAASFPLPGSKSTKADSSTSLKSGPTVLSTSSSSVLSISPTSSGMVCTNGQCRLQRTQSVAPSGQVLPSSAPRPVQSNNASRPILRPMRGGWFRW